MKYIKIFIMDIELDNNFIHEAFVWVNVEGRDEFTGEISWIISGFENVESETPLAGNDINELVERIYEDGLIDSSNFYRLKKYSTNYAEHNVEVA